ncbi:conserved hypothetical protein [Trichormus variabilis ATCC 29413]|uniref:Uncharacterized protein n=1 Tax=Trichormus variabilis (strain ATCC 29413 / PCC 7937) TaxID=240292 RepID=Q3MFE0_TRIV2|nr:conserved hypothetical protein [Trichormus variabilis ATCC 29413]
MNKDVNFSNPTPLHPYPLKSKVHASRQQLLHGKHLQNKLMSKITGVLFRKLLNKLMAFLPGRGVIKS